MDNSPTTDQRYPPHSSGAAAGWVRICAMLLVCGLALGGCSVRQMAAGAAADAIAGSGSSYAADDDIEFIGLATPFALKTTEGLLEQVPRHRDLLLAAARGFTQYAYVYVEQPADALEERDVDLAYAERGRARRMYLRARDYGLRGLAVANPAVAEELRVAPGAALATTTPEDVPLLYWTAAAWASAISLGKDDPALIADLPIVEQLIRRALELDESYDHGAIHVFLISYETSRSGLSESTVDRVRHHFRRAVELSEGLQAAPYVAMAEAVSVALQDRDEYRRLLGSALDIDVDARPEWRLANLVMQRRARWLLTRQDHLFLE
ncbi:MAG: TRAP transporter TatT component family protein [Gammaproteobacteria bacterium]|nr:TRAP transporter TatT component family protein [Gammaproteobacteria bacterium]